MGAQVKLCPGLTRIRTLAVEVLGGTELCGPLSPTDEE